MLLTATGKFGIVSNMAIEDYIYWDDGYGPDWTDFCAGPKRPKCNQCGSRAVYWHDMRKGKWLLYNNKDNSLHRCVVKPEELFEDLG